MMPSLEQARHWYDPDDPVHGFDHMVRVLRLSEKLAVKEGADLRIVRAAAILHDAWGGDLRNEVIEKRADHHFQSAEFAEKLLRRAGWSRQEIEAIRHCILSHRFRSVGDPPASIEAKVLFDADKLDAIGAIGVARAIAYAVKAGMPFYASPSRSFLENGTLLPDEPHSAFHEYVFKLVKIKDRLFTPSARALAEEKQRRMVAFFEALVQEMEG